MKDIGGQRWRCSDGQIPALTMSEPKRMRINAEGCSSFDSWTMNLSD